MLMSLKNLAMKMLSNAYQSTRRTCWYVEALEHQHECQVSDAYSVDNCKLVNIMDHLTYTVLLYFSVHGVL